MGPSFGSLFEALPDASPEELVERLAEGSGAWVERIVSTGQSSPDGFWYDQEQDELVLVAQGSAALEIEGREGELEVGPGDWVYLPAHCRHRVAWTSETEPTVWLAVHLTPASSRAED